MRPTRGEIGSGVARERAPGRPSSPAAEAASAAVQALARASRSLTLYDPRNAAARQLVADYQSRARAALATGDLALEIRPFEVLVAGESVHRDADSEKSLPFKLYRDGVRRLTIRPEVTGEELLQLLEILALRSTGVRQQEDDVVTLFRESEFRAIALEAVEGWTPLEESPEPQLDEAVERARRFQPPAGWDTPLPPLPQPGPLAWHAIPEDALLSLRAEDEREDAVATLALELGRDLLAEAASGGWPSPNVDLAAFFAELRDALLADGDLASLRRLLDLLAQSSGGELRDEVLRGLGDARTLELVLDRVAEGVTALPPDLVPFLPLLGLEPALDALSSPELSEGRRRLLSAIVLARLPRGADAVLARLPALSSPVACELARGIVTRAPEKANEVARRLLATPDEALRLEGLAALERSPGEVPLRPLCELLDDRSERVRIRVAEVLGRRGDESVIDALRAALEGGMERSLDEAEALGRALAEIAPIAAARMLSGWLEPKARFLRGITGRQRALQWAAVAGAGVLPGLEAETLLRGLADRADGELRRHCLATLARRRKAVGRG